MNKDYLSIYLSIYLSLTKRIAASGNEIGPSCKCCVTQKLTTMNSSVLYHKTKNAFEAKIGMKISFQLL